MTVLVTGAMGLIGNAVRVALEARGTPVAGTDLGTQTEEGRKLLPLDLCEPHRLHAILGGGRFEAIIHCGALSGPMVGREDPARIVAINTMGSLNVLEAARIHGVRRVVLCSSVAAFGRVPAGMAPVPEDVPLRPTTVYGASKAAVEAIMHGYVAEHGVQAVALRPGWVYGPRRTTDCAIREMLLAGLRGVKLRLPDAAGVQRQFVHVDDVARAAILALDAAWPLPGAAYTINGREVVTLGEVAAIVRGLFPAAEIGFGDAVDEDQQARFDLGAAERDLRFRPRVALADGIRSYGEWLRQRV